jgi:hypothetical protein
VSLPDQIDRLTSTFSADRAYCEHLFSSPEASRPTQLLVYHQWALAYLPRFQQGLLAMVPRHFAPVSRNDAEMWTAILTGGIIKDICLTPYFVIRGLTSEAGSVIRRALEHLGVLTHLWYDPAKIRAIQDPDSNDYMDAFVRERNKPKAAALSAQGIRKRFEKCSLGNPISRLYEVFSEYNVHGGKLGNMAMGPLEPTGFSCAFVNRSEFAKMEQQQLLLIVSGVEILCIETAKLHGEYGKNYGVTQPEVGEGAHALAALLSPSGSQSPEMNAHIQAIFAALQNTGGEDA